MPTLEQIQAKLKKLQAQADALIARKAQVAVDQIRDLMLKHGLTTEDIEAKAKAGRAKRALDGHAGHARNGNAKSLGTVKAAKYRDHKTGATWTGHGRAPGWIANVKDRTPFLIEGASEAKAGAKMGEKVGATRGKGQPKGAQPPKYLNPKTGATWSGRGPAPAWLASVKDRTRFLIDGAASAASRVEKGAKAAKVAKKASKVKAAATSGAVSKKAATKKVLAKKEVAAKKSAAKKATPASRKVVAKKGVAQSAAKRPVGRKSGAVKAARKAAATPAVTSAPAAPQTAAVEASA